jgi:hypothetical protein
VSRRAEEILGYFWDSVWLRFLPGLQVPFLKIFISSQLRFGCLSIVEQIHKLSFWFFFLFFSVCTIRFLLDTLKIILSGVGNGAVANGVIDPLVSGLACYATIQLKVLKHNLQHLSEHAEEECYAMFQHNIDLYEHEQVINKIIYNKIVKCVNHHIAIFK